MFFNKKSIVNKGDILAIPLSDGTFVYGQAVALYRESFYYVVVKYSTEKISDFDFDSFMRSKPILAGLTMDGRLYNDISIKIMASKRNTLQIELPEYKLDSADCVNLYTFKGRLKRTLKEGEVNNYQYRSTMPPILFDQAADAYMKNKEWLPKYDLIKYK